MANLRPITLYPNLDHPLARGLVFLAYPGGNTTVDLVGHSIGSVINGSFDGLTTVGPSGKTNSATTSAITFPHTPTMDSLANEITIMALMKLGSFADYGVIVGKPAYISGLWRAPYYSWGFHCNPIANNNGVFQVGDGTNWTTSNPGFIQVGDDLTMYGVTYKNGGNVDFWRNGKLHSTHTNAQNRTIDHGEKASLHLGNRMSTDLDEGIQGDWTFVAVWNRVLTADEIERVYDDPFIFVKEDKSRYYLDPGVFGTLFTKTVNELSRAVDLLKNTKQLYTTVQNTATANAAVVTGWTNAANGYTSNNSYATAAPANGANITSDYSGFGFSIPTNATIVSVTIEAEYKVSTTASVATFGMQAYVSGSAVGSEYTDTAEPTADTVRSSVVSYSFAPADLSDANFKVRVRATRSNATAVTFSLDMVRVTVVYRVPQASLLVRAINELLGSSESRSFARAKIISDTITLLETRLKKVFSTRNETSTIAQTDIASIAKTLGNTITIAQTLSTIKQLVRTFNNTITVVESRIKRGIKSLANTVTTTETRVKRDNKALNDVVTLTESRTKRGIKSLANSFTMVESRTKGIFKSLANAISTSEARSRVQLRSIANTVTLVQTQTKRVSKSISNALSIVETRSRQFLRSIANTSTIVQTMIKKPIKYINNSITGSETRSRQVSKALGNTITVIEGRVKLVRKSISQVLSFIATLDAQKLSGTIFYTIDSTITMVQSITKKAIINRAEIINTVQTITKRVNKILTNILAVAVSFSGDILAGLKYATIDVTVAIVQALTKRVSSTKNNSITSVQNITKRAIITRASGITLIQTTRKTIAISRNNIVSLSSTLSKQAKKSIAALISSVDTIQKSARVIFNDTLTTNAFVSRLFTYGIQVTITTVLVVEELKNVFVVQALRISRTVREFSKRSTTSTLQTAQRVTKWIDTTRKRLWSDDQHSEDWN